MNQGNPAVRRWLRGARLSPLLRLSLAGAVLWVVLVTLWER
jgi:hypothetical protein